MKRYLFTTDIGAHYIEAPSFFQSVVNFREYTRGLIRTGVFACMPYIERIDEC